LEINDSVVISSGEKYDWSNHPGFENLTETGVYSDTLLAGSGCDSVYYNLHLYVYSPEMRVSVAVDTACADDPAFTLRLRAEDSRAVTCDVLFGGRAHERHFRDTLGLSLPEGGGEILFAVDMPVGADSLDYVRPDRYDFQIRVTDIFGHEALFADTLTVLYPAWILVQRWNDVLMLSNDRYNGGYTFSSVRWYHAGSLVEARGDNDGYICQSLVMGDPYWAELTRTDDGRTMRTCIVYPSPQTNETTLADMAVSLVPRSWGDSRRIGVAANCSGTYLLYDVAGRIVGSGFFGEGYGSPDICLSSSSSAGTYLVAFRADDGRTVVRKWIVR
jgi:hypothetical protein